MRAIVRDRYGPTPEEVPRSAQIEGSTIADGEVLVVRVHLAGLDRSTWHVVPGPQYGDARGKIAVTFVQQGAVR